ncbi:50S ribosomal protein L23 [Tannockella kyphosi]|uniref:50S ribosomal protein L23 n=1 Tax=Tannockella kyphosi TaxID=2899121 RepID=UPI0020130CCD|nr:50S ribosomal protein L23 [Tannockella kyphosi]
MAHITDVLKKPVLTEKSLQLQEDNKYTFDVEVTSNKTEIKQAVEAMFGVKVLKVNVMNIKPKAKRVGKYEGKTNKRRKAIVTLAKGEEINYFESK